MTNHAARTGDFRLPPDALFEWDADCDACAAEIGPSGEVRGFAIVDDLHGEVPSIDGAWCENGHELDTDDALRAYEERHKNYAECEVGAP